ncbi:Flp pilus assembly protein CpaB [Pusillimonas sp. CC-YST705]|uniref:Flp pilus assembly protein CpaB n=1 Tax=Mesopusillimonas faecipullorum TaxID=2755040 RepID=A0ABS8CBI1_9BURK|nr:Flp pilus assembly protein CpaB [Mesopusillimonas faecipullorum]MCB5363212.1 Flp pilus assembly protein CpaB [Mesopusillimonas faecipullorum]
MRLPVSRQSAVLLGLAVFAGLGAAWFARQHIQQQVARIEARAQVPMVARVVAAHDLPPGSRIEAHHVAIREFPAQLVASDSVAPTQYATELQGRVLTAPLRAGDPILAVHAQTPIEAPFSSRLTKGRRAITMPIDEVNSTSGLLAPGDLIDLYVSFEHQRKRITAPLLQGVLVLATGQATSLQGAQGGYGTVTLDTAPEDAIKLVAARQGGIITALLRQRGDEQSTLRAVRGDLAALLGVGADKDQNASDRVAVIYGDRPVRSVAALRSDQTGQPESALFDLPEGQQLVSAWLQAATEEMARDLGLRTESGADHEAP